MAYVGFPAGLFLRMIDRLLSKEWKEASRYFTDEQLFKARRQSGQRKKSVILKPRQFIKKTMPLYDV
jgi:multimeric flavodoxin WrbA